MIVSVFGSFEVFFCEKYIFREKSAKIILDIGFILW